MTSTESIPCPLGDECTRDDRSRRKCAEQEAQEIERKSGELVNQRAREEAKRRGDPYWHLIGQI
jgi:hypothetical protein